jgi:lipid II:glycine glycyltransferase (peptidoglycan interpeptide bridge formation enzyme)
MHHETSNQDSSIWQTKTWWEMLVNSNQAEKIFEVNGIYIEKRKVSLWEFWLFILWLDKNISDEDLEQIIEICKEEKALFVQIETLSYKIPLSQPFPPGEKGVEQFKNWYYKKFITPYTAIIDLTKSEDEILSLMKPKWRYNIKLAEKKGVEVKEVEKTDANIEIYYNLMLETTSRDSFSWNSIDYYKTFLNTIKSSKLLLAYSGDKVIAGWVFVFDKDVSIYYYWASTSDKEYRNIMAPYLLQWEAIKIAKSFWSQLYDFLWVAKPWEKNSVLAWVTDFKLKLSQDVRKVSDSYIFVNKKIKYFIIELLRKLKKK